MPSRAQADPFRLGAFWLGIQMVWGAILVVSLQARASELLAGNGLSAYGALAAYGALTAAVTQIITGVLSDRLALRNGSRGGFYLVGAIAGGCAVSWFYSARSFGELVGAVIVLQIGMNVAIGPYQAAIPDFVADERVGTASSWMAAMQSAGNAAGALAAGMIAGARALAAILAAILIASCAVTFAHIRGLRTNSKEKSALRFSRAFADLFVSRALVYVGFYTLLGYLYFYVASVLGGNVKLQTALISLLFTLSGIAGAAAAARPADGADRRAIATAGGALVIAGLVAMLLSRSGIAIALSAAVAGVAWGIFLTADWALGCRFLPRSALATAMGIWNLALLIAQIAAPIIATGLLTALHRLRSPSAAKIAFLLAAVEIAAGILWIWRLPASRVSVETVRAGNTA